MIVLLSMKKVPAGVLNRYMLGEFVEEEENVITLSSCVAVLEAANAQGQIQLKFLTDPMISEGNLSFEGNEIEFEREVEKEHSLYKTYIQSIRQFRGEKIGLILAPGQDTMTNQPGN